MLPDGAVNIVIATGNFTAGVMVADVVIPNVVIDAMNRHRIIVVVFNPAITCKVA